MVLMSMKTEQTRKYADEDYMICSKAPEEVHFNFKTQKYKINSDYLSCCPLQIAGIFRLTIPQLLWSHTLL